MHSKSVLVTGANGFLGAAIVRELNSAGIVVHGTGRQATSIRPIGIYHQADITQIKQLAHVCKGVSTVIHAAGLAHVFAGRAISPKRFLLVNAGGTANVMSAAVEANVQHFILISSVAVYGQHAHHAYREDDFCSPVGPYAVSKYRAEEKARDIAKKAGVSLTILRLATLYGEGDPGNMDRLMRTLDKRRFIWIGDGCNHKSLLHIRDAARACLAVVLRPRSGVRVYNVCGPPCTMREIVNGLVLNLRKRPLPGRIRPSIALAFGRWLSTSSNERLAGLHATVQKWLGEDVYETSCFQNDYEFCPKISLENGLRRQVEWYRQNQNRRRFE